MTTYTFDDSVPAASHTPSQDQSPMQNNNVSTKAIIGVDHVTFGAANGGTHLQCSFASNQTPSIGSNVAILYPGANPSGYSNPGGPSATNAYLLNADGTFPMSMIKAGGTFTLTNTSGTLSFNSSFNCSSLTNNSGSYRVELTGGIATGNNVIVLLSMSGNGIAVMPTWSFSNPNLFINASGLVVGNIISFLVLQI